MKKEEKEITALLHLIEDPDPAIFEVVGDRIISYGEPVIPDLENLWEHTADNHVQERIEALIHRIYYSSITEDFKQWAQSPHRELLSGVLLVNKLLYPDLYTEFITQNIELLRRNIWLELNDYLTPLEQVAVFNNIFYRYFGLRGDYNHYKKPDEFLLNKIIETKKGNQTGNGILYLILADMLHLPVKLIQIPNQFILAGFQTHTESELPQIEFFINPVGGQIFSHHDLHFYFNRIGQKIDDDFLTPCNDAQVVQKLLSDLAKCYADDNTLLYEDIRLIIDILN